MIASTHEGTDATGCTPTRHDKAEWSRMAQDAYRLGRPDIGHRYSAAAALPDGATLTCERFDFLMMDYRRWLLDGRLT